MKKLIFLILVILAIAFVVKRKVEEYSHNEMAVKQYLIDRCQGDSHCEDQTETQFGECFTHAYEFSVIPGRDRIRTTTLASCLSERRDWFHDNDYEHPKLPFPAD
ncbi:MAG: hypothetical protein WBX15_00245 [Thermoanaerobaculia bacterium]